jgi:ribonuclease R
LNKDPQFERESERYENPIASREFITETLRKHAAPMVLDELAEFLELTGANQREALRRRLAAMVRDGQLVRNRREGFVLVDERDLVRGRVVAHPDGYGFLVPDEGVGDLYLGSKEMRALLHGDRIVARVCGIDGRGRREGRLVDVLERANEQVVGRLFFEGGLAFVLPDNRRIHQEILIPSEAVGTAGEGDIVVAAITNQPSRHRQPMGRILEVLGAHMMPGMEIEVAIFSHAIPARWPSAVEAQIPEFDVVVSPMDEQGRLDLRDLPLVTIDGEDAKDFDDAVYCQPRANGWRLLVAIADVSHYVRPESALDQEAQRRGTSVYFPGRVVPMLPEVLSNGLCSLNPQVDRLCMVCDMSLGPDGELKRSRFVEAIMRSHARLTYTEVARILASRKDPLRQKYPDLVPHLDNLYRLFKVLFKARARRGAIEFETVETRIEFDADKKIAAILPVQRNDAHRLIEECMIQANVAAARFLRRHKIPGLFRIHAGPASDKLEDLRAFLAERGLGLGGGDSPEAPHYAKLIKQTSGRPDAHVIQTVLLRSLQRAVYHPDNIGHFGLALEQYTHFTSPIRRYPDLLVHRAIRHMLRGGQVSGFYSQGEMVLQGDHCSMTEQRADEATRDVVDWLKCEFMQDHIGDTFKGVITGVAPFGLFVELGDVYVEGMVHVTALPRDYYQFDPIRHCLVGKRSGAEHRLGDPLSVRVTRVDLDDRKIDFELSETVRPKRRVRRHLGRKSAV